MLNEVVYRCSREIFPYLVVVIGLENVLVLTKSVVSTPVDLEVKLRIAQGEIPWTRYQNTHQFVMANGRVEEMLLYIDVATSGSYHEI